MKIALVTMRTDPARGGAERYTVDLAAALAAAGHDVTLVASEATHVPAGVRGEALDARGWTRVRRYNRFVDSVDAHVDAVAYDVVHAMLPVRRCHLYHPHAGVQRATTATDTRVDRMLNPRRIRVAGVERSLLEGRRPPIVLCLSEYVRRAVREWYDLDETHTPVVFNGVDVEHYDPARVGHARDPARASLQLDERTVAAAFVGHDFERKGLRQALFALREVRDASVPMRLVVVGRDPRGRAVALAREAGVQEALIRAGATADAYAMYRAADFVVLPTRHDPCSLVVLEALAMGVPVISTRFNGACEIMVSGVHGYVLDDPTDIGALAAAMRDLADPALRARMAGACLELRSALAFANHLRTLVAIYERVRGAPL